MKSKVWVVIAKIVSVLFALYGLILLWQVIRDVQQYNANPQAYTIGLGGVLAKKVLNIALAVVSVSGCVLMLANKKWGWIFTAGVQLLVTVLIIWLSIDLSGSGKGASTAAIIGLVITVAIVLFCFAIMLTPAVRKRYHIRAVEMTLALVLAMVLVVINYLF